MAQVVSTLGSFEKSRIYIYIYIYIALTSFCIFNKNTVLFVLFLPNLGKRNQQQTKSIGKHLQVIAFKIVHVQSLFIDYLPTQVDTM